MTDIITEHADDAATDLALTMGSDMDYSRADTSFSPFYSDMGLGFNGSGGISTLYLHYNRRTTHFLEPSFLAVSGTLKKEDRTLLEVTQGYDEGTVRYGFCGHDTWLADGEGISGMSFHFGSHAGLLEARRADPAAGIILFDGYIVPPKDRKERDPDNYYPFCLGLRIIHGTVGGGDGLTAPLVITPDSNKKITVAFSARILETEHASIIERLNAAPDNADTCVDMTREWLKRGLHGFRVDSDDPREKTVLCRAVHSLLSNCCRAPGKLAGRIAAFPARGEYPTQFLWDSCFQNLAYEHMDPAIAEDSLLLLTENLREDGKMGLFICSTWMHPHESQPPLVGWAGLRLVKQRNDPVLAKKLLPALQKNTRWWLHQRMTRFGLISALSGFETGWDDSPKFDNGPTVACDMNTYLVLQIRACAEFSRMLGDEAGARQQDAEADVLAQRMVDVLYDEKEHVFWDRNVKTGEPVKLITPSCFLPLMADVPLPEAERRRMIEDVMLDPELFFGEFPFPSVAYTDPVYRPGKWWRGPIWVAIAYLLGQILEKYAYTEASVLARRKLYDMIIADGDLREHFNSQTGEGKGEYEQSWTAAICLQLHAELSGQPCTPV